VAPASGADDVAFTADLLDHLQSTLCEAQGAA
jgi:hypothetical protein